MWYMSSFLNMHCMYEIRLVLYNFSSQYMLSVLSLHITEFEAFLKQCICEIGIINVAIALIIQMYCALSLYFIMCLFLVYPIYYHGYRYKTYY